MKAALLAILVVHTARADCTKVTHAQAVAAVKALSGATFVEFRSLRTLNTPTAPATARRVSATGDVVQLDGRTIDLASVYVQTPHHDYANLAVTVGCPTAVDATYDPRDECEKLDDEILDAKQELADAIAKTPKASTNIKLLGLSVQNAQLRSQLKRCHAPAHPRTDRNECRDNPLAKGCQ